MRINWKTGKIECCGLHETCVHNRPETASVHSRPAEYYDDEELDVFHGRPSDSYTAEEVALFREVQETLLESDREGWLQSLAIRNIALPCSLNRLYSQ
ncbi:MAG: hypothetical protein LBJ17_01035 [Dysgonamonadaceae bacterium]|jgi:hypothetical protein|nr:hypothetical protein [Dysgonamonadaceae bacterium]